MDHASRHIHISPQVHPNAHKTIKAKKQCEDHCKDYSTVPQDCLSDNHSAFTSASHTLHLKQFAQVSKFANIGAHHHNAITERSIQMAMSITRTMIKLVAN